MKLIDNFFTLQSQGKDQSGNLVCRVRLNPEHFIFKAHFPGNPIVPGVCQIQVAAEILSRELAIRVHLSEIRNIKFLSLMTPSEQLEYDMTFKQTEIDSCQIKTLVQYGNGGKIYTKMSLTFKKNTK